MDLQVDRSDLHRTRVVELDPAPLTEGQARLRVDAFGLSANNVTYAVIGDMLQYWDFFPAEEGWGRVPVWGYADVVESTHPELPVGRRCFGYLPMSEELVVSVGRVDEGGFSDESPHRRAMASAYSRYRLVDPAAQIARLCVEPPEKHKDPEPHHQRHRQRGIDRDPRVKQEVRHSCPPAAQAARAASASRRAGDTSRQTGR